MLEVRDLNAYYGKSHILQGVNLDVSAGEVVSLLGRNGVGPLHHGQGDHGRGCASRQHSLQGARHRRPAQLPHRAPGPGLCAGKPRHLPLLTVAQNLLLGQKNPRRQGRWRLRDMLDMFPNLQARADTAAGVLSGGEKQMLTMCRTLMGDPELIMIDEPTEGLAPLIVKQVGELISEIARRGLAILLVEQKLSIALDISKRVYVMGHGRIVFEGTPADLKARRRCGASGWRSNRQLNLWPADCGIWNDCWSGLDAQFEWLYEGTGRQSIVLECARCCRISWTGAASSRCRPRALRAP